MIKELHTLFPEADLATGSGYRPAVRRTLCPYKARVLFSTVLAA